MNFKRFLSHSQIHFELTQLRDQKFFKETFSNSIIFSVSCVVTFHHYRVPEYNWSQPRWSKGQVIINLVPNSIFFVILISGSRTGCSEFEWMRPLFLATHTWHHHLYLCICVFASVRSYPHTLARSRLLHCTHNQKFTRHHWNEISLPLMILILSSFILRQCNLQLRQHINQLVHARTYTHRQTEQINVCKYIHSDG